MLKLPINVKENGEVSITYNTAYLEETMYAEKKGKELKKKYLELVKTIKNIPNIYTLIESNEKNKPTKEHWQIGKEVVDFIQWGYDNAIEVPNLSNALSKSIDGSHYFWDIQIKFYATNPDGKYIKYRWALASILGSILKEETREIITKLIDKNQIKDQNDIQKYCYIIENKMEPLAPGRKKVYDFLNIKDGTQDEIAKATGLTRDSVRGRVSELKGIHRYDIPKSKKGIYHLNHNEEKRKKKIKQLKEDIETVKKEIEEENNERQ